MNARSLWPIVLAFAAIPAHAAAPVWESIGPGGGGWIQSICASPHAADELFVGCDVGGFYRSADAGQSYRTHNAGLRDYWVECIAPHPTDPRIIYIGCESGVYRSADRGRSWQWLRNGFPPKERHRWSAPIGALAIDPTRPDTAYAGIGRPRRYTFGRGAAYKTTDGGATWARANRPGSLPADAWVSDLLVHPRDGARLLLACQHGVFQSRDAGANWQRTITGLPHPHVRRIARCTAKPDVLYLTLRSEPGKKPWQGGVYKSVDGGQHWTACTKGLKQWVGRPDQPAPMTSNYDRIVVHPANPDVAYVGGDAWVTSTLYKTTDGGQSWTDVVRRGEDANIDPGWITFWGPTVKCLTLSPIEPDVLYFGTSGMVYRTTDGGRRWTPAYCRVLPDGRFRGTGLEVTCLHNISVHPRHPEWLYLGYYDIGLLVSHDAGRTFRRAVAGIKPHHAMNNSCFDIAFDPADDRHCWGSFGSWSANIGVVAESHDGGLSWKMVGTPEAGLPNARHRALLLDPRERTLFTTADGQGVFASRDGGKSWQPRKTGLPHGHVVDLVLHPRTAGSLWCLLRSHGDEPGGVYHTGSGGATWQLISRGLVVSDVKALAIAPSDPRRLYLAARQGWFGKGGKKQLAEGGVFRSDDGGHTWRRILEDDFAQGLAVDPRNADVVYAGLTDHPYHDESTGDGIVVTRDGGTTWSSLNGTLTCKQVGRITIDPHQPNRLYIGTHGNGAFVGVVQETR